MSRKVLNNNPSLKDVLDISTEYIGFVDFPKKDGHFVDFTLEIDSVSIDEIPIPNSNKTQSKCVVNFKKAKKGLILSGTKLKKVLKAYGQPELWKGKVLILKANPEAKFRGKTVGGVSVEIPVQGGLHEK